MMVSPLSPPGLNVNFISLQRKPFNCNLVMEQILSCVSMNVLMLMPHSRFRNYQSRGQLTGHVVATMNFNASFFKKEFLRSTNLVYSLCFRAVDIMNFVSNVPMHCWR